MVRIRILRYGSGGVGRKPTAEREAMRGASKEESRDRASAPTVRKSVEGRDKDIRSASSAGCRKLS